MLFVSPAQRDGGDDDKCSQENEEDEGEDGEDEMNTDTMSKYSHSLAFTNGLS